MAATPAPTLCAPAWPIDAPPLRPSVNGLLAYAERPGATQDQVVTPGGAAPIARPEGWESGFGFRPLTCSGLLAFVNDFTDHDKLDSLGEFGDEVTVQPYNLIGALECTVLSFRNLDAETQAMINVALSDAVEEQVWSGTALDENPSFTDGRGDKLASGAGVTLATAFALLDQAVTEALHGALGMIHVTPYVLARAADYATGIGLRWQSDRWVTPNGHTVVAGSGYSGAAPRTNVGDAATSPPDLLANPPVNQWAYGTGPVFVRLAPLIRATPVGVTSLNPENNRQRFIVERVGAAYFSPCAQFGVNIDLTP